MENQVKTVYYANFNITFGDDNEPMLTHFIDIIYPAFQAGYKRGKEDERPNFYFTGVNLTAALYNFYATSEVDEASLHKA